MLVAADLTVHAAALADLAEDPRPATAALVSSQPRRPARATCGCAPAGCSLLPRRRTGCPSRARRSPEPCGSARGTAQPRPAAADELAALARRHGWTGDPLAYLLVGLVRSGRPGRRGQPGPVAVAARLGDVDGTPRQADLDAMDTAGRCTTSGSPGPPRPTTASSPPSSAGRSPGCSRRRAAARPDAQPGDRRLGRRRAGRGGSLRRRRAGRARRRCSAAAAVSGARLRRRRRGPLHPPVQPARCLAGRVDRPAQGVRLLRRPRVGRRGRDGPVGCWRPR